MRKALLYFWKEQPIALGVFVMAMALLLYFGGRFMLGFIYFHDPAHRNQALEGWMTPRYVSMSYAIPPEKLREVMGIPKDGKMRVRLKDITTDQGISLQELQDRVWALKREHEAEREAHKAMTPEERRAERDARREADQEDAR